MTQLLSLRFGAFSTAAIIASLPSILIDLFPLSWTLYNVNRLHLWTEAWVPPTTNARQLVLIWIPRNANSTTIFRQNLQFYTSSFQA
ncbi:hypothetical protein B0O99DRAFT_316587 [Bisporella sp. PMI_857]|nr:hypothetical protein B0O99DRAFT_316587 [Bisporella sp. PMI_857]